MIVMCNVLHFLLDYIRLIISSATMIIIIISIFHEGCVYELLRQTSFFFRFLQSDCRAREYGHFYPFFYCVHRNPFIEHWMHGSLISHHSHIYTCTPHIWQCIFYTRMCNNNELLMIIIRWWCQSRDERHILLFRARLLTKWIRYGVFCNSFVGVCLRGRSAQCRSQSQLPFVHNKVYEYSSKQEKCADCEGLILL